MADTALIEAPEVAVQALDKLQKIRTISEKTLRHCENEHYESESVLNKELHEIFQSLAHIEFWTWERIREMEQGDLEN